MHIYHPQTKLLEGYVFTVVCHSVHGGRECIQDATQMYAPPGCNPDGCIPLDATHIDAPHARSMHPTPPTPPEVCTPARSMHPPLVCTPAGSMHPCQKYAPRLEVCIPTYRRQTVNRREVLILLECILVLSDFHLSLNAKLPCFPSLYANNFPASHPAGRLFIAFSLNHRN